MLFKENMKMLDWDLFYGNDITAVTLISRYKTRLTTEMLTGTSTFRISYCDFKDVSANIGGAILIYVQTNEIKTLINDCLFHTCYTTQSLNDGGAILYSCAKGQLAIYKTCSYLCYTANTTSDGVNHGQFIATFASKVKIK